jgi:hypothetical protein
LSGIKEMPVCSICGKEHPVLDPTFRRPEAFERLDSSIREAHAIADDDLCSIKLPGVAARWFVRGVLPVVVVDRSEDLWWGLWAEVSEEAFKRIVELWSAPEQERESPFSGQLANLIPSYPDTLGLPLTVQLTGTQSRPTLRFESANRHPFAHQCETGVDSHQAAEWNRLIENE